MNHGISSHGIGIITPEYSDLSTSTVQLGLALPPCSIVIDPQVFIRPLLKYVYNKIDCFKPCFPMGIGLYVLMFNLLTDHFKSVNKAESAVTLRVLFSSQIFMTSNVYFAIYVPLSFSWRWSTYSSRKGRGCINHRVRDVIKFKEKKCNRYAIRHVPPKTETCHDANFVAIGGTGICRYINRRCCQGRQIWLSYFVVRESGYSM